ncbi:hypothetical protein AVEN_114887-1, partial [Araneus ventricosus]
PCVWEESKEESKRPIVHFGAQFMIHLNLLTRMGGKRTSHGANGMEQSTRKCPALSRQFICIPFHPFGPRLVFLLSTHSSRKIRHVHSSEVPKCAGSRGERSSFPLYS